MHCLECQTINPCICNSLYSNIFLINHYCLFECNLAHPATLLFEIKSKPMHPLSGVLSLPYALARVTRGAHRHSFATPRCGISQYLPTSQYLFGTILVTLCLMVWDWPVLRAEPIHSWHPKLLFLFVSYFLLDFLPRVGCVWLGNSD